MAYKKRKISHHGAKYKKKTYFNDVLSHKSKLAPQRRTAYAETLINPFKEMPVRIPDLSSYPTATFSQELHYTWTVNTLTTNANNQLLVIQMGQDMIYYHCQGSLSAVVKGAKTGAAAIADFGNAPVAIGDTDLDSRWLKYRVVSAAAQVKFADNDTNTKGLISGIFIPGDMINTAVQNTGVQQGQFNISWGGSGSTGNFDSLYNLTSMDKINKYAGACTAPLVDGMTVRYAPCDGSSFEMVPVTDATVALVAGARGQQNFGSLVFCVEGHSDVVLQVTVSINCEGIPKSDVIGIETAKGPSDPSAAGHGMEVAGGLATAFPADPKSVASNITTPLRLVQNARGR